MAIRHAKLGQAVYFDGVAAVVTNVSVSRVSVKQAGRNFAVQKGSTRISPMSPISHSARVMKQENTGKRRRELRADITETFRELASAVRGAIDPLTLTDVLNMIEAKKRFELSRV